MTENTRLKYKFMASEKFVLVRIINRDFTSRFFVYKSTFYQRTKYEGCCKKFGKIAQKINSRIVILIIATFCLEFTL